MTKEEAKLELKRKRYIPIIDDIKTYISAWRYYKSGIYSKDILSLRQKLRIVGMIFFMERTAKKFDI